MDVLVSDMISFIGRSLKLSVIGIRMGMGDWFSVQSDVTGPPIKPVENFNLLSFIFLFRYLQRPIFVRHKITIFLCHTIPTHPPYLFALQLTTTFPVRFSDVNLSALYLKYFQDLNQAANLMRLSSIQPPSTDLLNLITNKRTASSDLLNLITNKRTASSSEDKPAGEDVFACPKCSKTYLRQYTLNAHLRYECGKRPKFKCPHCNKKCHQKCNLKSHIALKHDQVTQIWGRNQ